jgi:hypothetical protein
MRVRLLAPLTAALVAGTIGLTAGTAAAAPAAATAPAASTAAVALAGVAPVAIPSTQTTQGTFVGTFTPSRFVTSNGQLAVVGTVTGTLTSATGVITPVSDTATSTITQALAAGSCTILNLTLGPLHLDVLGLVIDLNQVHLTITAQQGPGNLLGNLLCAVANLLNGGNTGGLATLLNRILGLLGGL